MKMGISHGIMERKTEKHAMKEHLHTIPLNEAFDSHDECPFCFLRRQSEQRILRYVAGPSASYMEPEVRDVTNETGFCPAHLKKLYDYGNTLGSALMLQTYYARILEKLHGEIECFERPAPKKLFTKPKETALPLGQFLQKETASCYICNQLENSMDRYYRTFFSLVKEPEFRAKVESCNGFCLTHFGELLHNAQLHLPNSQRDWFYTTVFPVMERNLTRVKEDLDWLIAKYDYRNASADWRNSRDALQRTMQKLGGGYVADKPFKDE